jgi:alpha-glucosidase
MLSGPKLWALFSLLPLALVMAKPVSVAHPLAKRDDAIITIPSPVEHTGNVDACGGYKASDVSVTDTGIDATLDLIGTCNAYGPDYPKLKLTVRYETKDRLRVHIADADGKAHVVPDDVASWPKIGDAALNSGESALKFEYVENPFSFKVTRKSDGEVLFDTTGEALIFEEQYVRVKSKLAAGSNIQGLGQHNDNFT